MAKVLVVDDDSANRALIATVLGHAGHAGLQANDGADGLKVARAENPEIIIWLRLGISSSANSVSATAVFPLRKSVRSAHSNEPKTQLNALAAITRCH